MTNVKCSDCAREYNSAILSRCPDCKSTNFKEIKFASAAKSEKIENNSNKITEDKKVHKENAITIAISSAKIVNAYGTYIQVFGIIFGILMIFGGIILSFQTKTLILAFGGVALGALDIAIFAVQGALFRMLSNYVIARLEKD
jgi:hypothetical protein